MTASTKTTLIRKAALALGAIAISTMTLAGAADAKPKFSIQLNLGGGHGIHGSGVVIGWTGPSCSYFWNKYQKTGKWHWKKLYYQCKGVHYH